MTKTFKNYMSDALLYMLGTHTQPTKLGAFIRKSDEGKENTARLILGMIITFPPAILYACAAKTIDGFMALGSAMLSGFKAAGSALFKGLKLAGILLVAPFVIAKDAIKFKLKARKEAAEATNNFEPTTQDATSANDVTTVVVASESRDKDAEFNFSEIDVESDLEDDASISSSLSA